ncbi:ABC transporter ATP-binding protein [Quadrisphaera sp. INWT6]|uniref:ABC transporter ATP-binding protein n=1 Tax=Quadrisphaera sp. INWT6 TaxID=2596917 RepID=UPI00189236EF|nr:ATP-binding cassette domain-containing protein [Quadrisphaera sp. INWT6]MBF5083070.1 ATP-binding cassette domain-containing protein [Quadrisphaera sp. INWT6]
MTDAPAAPPAVRARGLTKRFGQRAAVDDLDLDVAEGTVYGLLGPNGAGKTTFMRMLFGLVGADAGTLEVFGRTWAHDGVATLAPVAGFIESPRFYPYLTGRANLRLLATLDRVDRRGDDADARIGGVLDTVDLLDRADEKVSGYSYGMRQRLGVAAALLREPRLLVLDEPANGLDPAGIRDMRALVTRLARSGLTVLLSSHDMDEVEQICDHVTIMSKGRVAFTGSLHRLRALAPAPTHLITTSDDLAALRVLSKAASRLDDVSVTTTHGALALRGPQAAIDRCVITLADAGVAVRTLVPGTSPLEAVFFSLTEPEDVVPTHSHQPEPGAAMSTRTSTAPKAAGAPAAAATSRSPR